MSAKRVYPKRVRKDKAPSDTSDGHHTFQALYDQRAGILAALCNMTNLWAGVKEGTKAPFKSRKHDDGTMYDGFFIVGVPTKEGWATYHIEDKWWEAFRVEEVEHAPIFDGHTPEEALARLVRNFCDTELPE